MTPTHLAALAERIVAASACSDDGSCVDTDVDVRGVEAALVDVRRIRAWADAQEASLISSLRGAVACPEAVVADASKCSLGTAGKATERANTIAHTPSLADALVDGHITAGHIDAVTRATKRLEPDQQAEFVARADHLTDVAAAATVDEFRRRLDHEVKRLRRDDGEERLARQKRSTRWSSWTDGEGMWNVRGAFDPELAVRLSAAIDRSVATLFAEETPEYCPSDAVEKNKFLAAHALARLVCDGGHPRAGRPRAGRPEFVAVIDADAPAPNGPAVEWSVPVELPARVIAELAVEADVAGVVVRNGVVLHAPGELDLGRSTRLASPAQRRALRALYRTCAVPGCTVGYDRCKLHHITWWRNGGATDLANLLPVCSNHHTRIHQDGWDVSLGPRRELTLRLPDGRIRNTGPPSRSAA